MIVKRISIAVGIVLAATQSVSPVKAASPAGATLYVSPLGSDASAGTLAKPFKSITRARDAVRAINAKMSGDIHVILRGGTFTLTGPIEFGPQDSGFNGHSVIYEAYPNEKPVLSGGVAVTGWALDHDGIYKAKLDRSVKLRSLFVNGVRANMTAKPVHGLGAVGTFTVAGIEAWAESSGSAPDGIRFSTGDVGALRNPDDVELSQQYTWNASIIGVRNIVQDATGTVVQLQQPAGAITTTLNWGCGLKPDGRFMIRNAYELLRHPGEFYFDKAARTIYYDCAGEDMSKVSVIAPRSEGHIKIAGESTTKRVQGLVFKGLDFAFDDWQLANVAGSHLFAGVQSAAIYMKYRRDGDWHRDKYNMCDLPQGCVDVRNAANIRFDGNSFEHLNSGTAISFANDVVDSAITGNVFRDLAGNAVIVGHPQHGYVDGTSTRFPVGVLGICTNDIVSNNVIRDVSLDYHQLEGIIAFFVDGLQILHNDIQGTPYGGITLGWGWSNQPASTTCRNNTIGYNRVVNANQILRDDGGPIYTLGQQPNSRIIGNYVKNGPRQIYTDEGSAFFKVTDNVLENAGSSGKMTANHGDAWFKAWTKTIHDIVIDGNYTTTSTVENNGTKCPITNTHVETLPWSKPAQAIIDNAGLEPEYRHLLPPPPKVALSPRATLPLRVALGSPADAVLAPFVSDDALPSLTKSGIDGIFSDVTATKIDISKVKNPAPPDVYYTEAWGRNMLFSFTGLNPNQPCLVRLHFVDTNRSAVGERVFDILINQTPVLAHFDIVKEAGGKYIAVLKEFQAKTDEKGSITINLTSANPGCVENAEIRGIEILPSPGAGTK